MRISDWSSDVCSSDLEGARQAGRLAARPVLRQRLVGFGALDAGYGRRIRKGAAKFRMGAGAMVALAVILPHQLPISLLYDGRLVRDLGDRKRTRMNSTH